MDQSGDRRQQAEDRWRRALESHEKDPEAHARERHRRTDEWVRRFQVPLELRVYELEKSINNLKEFRAQVMLVGTIALLLIGAGFGALAYRLFGVAP